LKVLVSVFALTTVALAAATVWVHASPAARHAAAKPTPLVIKVARPTRYTIPKPFVRVRTAAGLHRALARSTPTRIVLQQGVYDSDDPFVDAHGHAVYSATLGEAVLSAGLLISGSRGALVRGVVVDADDQSKGVEGTDIRVTAAGAQVLDVVLRGNKEMRAGLAVKQPEGFRAARLVVRDFTDYGVLVDANDRGRTSLQRPAQLRDMDVAGVSRSDPGSSRGTSEACVWIGNPASVSNVRARRCAWTGLWTGTAATNAHFDGIDIDGTRTGVYIEHFTHLSTFNRIRVGPGVRVGLTAEWASPDWGSEPASVDNIVDHSRFESSLAGVYLDKGTTRTTIRRSTFVGQQWAAIGDYAGVDNRFYANDYRGLASGAATVTQEHIPAYEDKP
jgi:hypothetical protein